MGGSGLPSSGGGRRVVISEKRTEAAQPFIMEIILHYSPVVADLQDLMMIIVVRA